LNLYQLNKFILDFVAGVVIAREQFLAERDTIAEVVLTGVNLCLVTLLKKLQQIVTSII
jgi:hypothetical protein